MKNNKLFLLLFLLLLFRCSSENNSIYQFDANENLFTAYAFMNAAGYDHDWSEMSPIRVEIRDYLDNNLSGDFKKIASDFFVQHGSGGFSAYGTYALLLSEAPEFRITDDSSQYKQLLIDYKGLDDLYRNFYQEAGIQKLWKRYRIVIQEINDEYKPFADVALSDIIQYCKLDKDYFLKRAATIYFSICPQMSHFTAFTTEINGNLYIINGPTDSKPGTGAFYHEALHHVINPLTEKYIDLVNQYKELLEVSSQQRFVGYDDWESNVDDSFCRTMSMVLNGIHSGNSGEEIKSWVQNEYKLGFILCMHIFEILPDYENSGKTFEEFYPTFFSTINIDKEKKRWEEFCLNNDKNI